ncbi:exostosin [Trypanosoma theileri]|uniref:Exostosin n=1 Tax=Trypanosoma theileri TaxID=67003 RepID=A0A1X0P5K4_9TRYP|nr:exostosin [Trypanosoma theileri]ORC91829.1 exostosin [Trypanosoma theileri]
MVFRQFRNGPSRRFILVALLFVFYLFTMAFVIFSKDDNKNNRPKDDVKENKHVVVDQKAEQQKSVGQNDCSRCPSDPFVTGDGFRASCQLIFDDTVSAEAQKNFLEVILRTVETKRIEEGLSSSPEVPIMISVFVQPHCVEKFIEYCLKRVERSDSGWKLLLVSHNSDVSIPYNKNNLVNKNDDHNYENQIYWVLDNPRVAVWYATNTAIEHPKLWTIPIGIENRYNAYGKHVRVYREAYHNIRTRNRTRDEDNKRKLLLIAFSISTFRKYRSEVLRVTTKAFEEYSANITLVGKKKKGGAVTAKYVRSYLNLLTQHKFVLAPRGNGMDTHRLWETLYMGSVPIVQRSTLDSRLLSALPILLVDNFSEVTPSLLTSPEALALTAPERFKAVDDNFLSMAYWRQIITPNRTRN